MAETIEEEEESGAREERDMEPSMVTTRVWDKQPNHKTYILYHDSCEQYRTIFQLIQILKNKTRPNLTMLCPNSTLLTLGCMALGQK